MGWMEGIGFRIGTGRVASPHHVKEPAGYEGERVTPVGSMMKITIPRNDRKVFATEKEAMKASRKLLKEAYEQWRKEQP